MADDTESSTDHTSIDVKALQKSMRGKPISVEALQKSMKGKLGPDESPLPSTCCIFKVPQVLRRHNPRAYQPDVVSIGPYHRHRKQLQRMETVKRWYFRNLLTRMKISPEEFIQLINGETGNDLTAFEKRARSSYAEPLDHLKKEEFMEIMVLDGCFVIQLFRNFKDHKEKKDEPILNEEKEDDPILNMDCMFQYICHDLLLLENQLPWFVLSCLYRLTLGSNPGDASEFRELLLEGFCSLDSLEKYFYSYSQHLRETKQKVDETGHKVDENGQKVDETGQKVDETGQKVNETGQKILCSLFGLDFAPYITKKKKPGQKVNEEKVNEKKFNEDQVLHILDLIRTFIVFKFQPFKPSSRRNNKKWLCWFGEKEEEKTGPEIPAATALSEAGVKFRRSSDNNLMNIEFKKGVLTIPELAVAELTEPLFRNLIAFEQCYHGRSHRITSYAFFMDKLISSDKDIKLLCDKNILANWLNVEDGSKFFNSLYIDTTVKKFRYGELCVEVNKYYHVKWNTYREQLWRDHCSSPWKAIALAVGILILVLQLLQFILRVLTSF